MHTDSFPTAHSGRLLLWCGRCRQAAEVTHGDVLASVAKGWPTCCGEVMAYFAEARHPGATVDAVERPAFQ